MKLDDLITTISPILVLLQVMIHLNSCWKVWSSSLLLRVCFLIGDRSTAVEVNAGSWGWPSFNRRFLCAGTFLRCVISASVLVWPFGFQQDQYLCYSSVLSVNVENVVAPSQTCIESDHGELVARSLIVQGEQRASLSRVWRSVCSSQTLMLSHILPSHNEFVWSAESRFSVSQDFGSLSNLQVTQPTVGMNFRTPRGV